MRKARETLYRHAAISPHTKVQNKILNASLLIWRKNRKEIRTEDAVLHFLLHRKEAKKRKRSVETMKINIRCVANLWFVCLIFLPFQPRCFKSSDLWRRRNKKNLCFVRPKSEKLYMRKSVGRQRRARSLCFGPKQENEKLQTFCGFFTSKSTWNVHSAYLTPPKVSFLASPKNHHNQHHHHHHLGNTRKSKVFSFPSILSLAPSQGTSHTAPHHTKAMRWRKNV